MNFEQLIARLNEITTLLESKNTSLEESFLLFDEGLKISKQCNELLEEYSNRLNSIKENYSEAQNKVDNDDGI